MNRARMVAEYGATLCDRQGKEEVSEFLDYWLRLIHRLLFLCLILVLSVTRYLKSNTGAMDT